MPLIFTILSTIVKASLFQTRTHWAAPTWSLLKVTLSVLVNSTMSSDHAEYEEFQQNAEYFPQEDWGVTKTGQLNMTFTTA